MTVAKVERYHGIATTNSVKNEGGSFYDHYDRAMNHELHAPATDGGGPIHCLGPQLRRNGRKERESAGAVSAFKTSIHFH